MPVERTKITRPRATTYEQRVEISADGDRRQAEAGDGIAQRGFFPDINAILIRAAESSDPVGLFDAQLADEFRSDDFAETITAANLNGALIATYIQRRHEQAAGFGGNVAQFFFAEQNAASVADVIAYWSRVLNLTDEQAQAMLERVRSQQRERDKIARRVREAATDRVQEIFAKYGLTGANIERGDSVQKFIDEAREKVPNATRANLETEYRTRLTEEYGTTRLEQITARENVFPFIQFMAIKDGRTTWWICLPMGTAGPNGRGYIAASDDPVWSIWRPPNHFACRSDVSPISYLEAQRMGILAADGRTRIAIKGNNPNRPYGDPPRFAEDPITSKLRAVEPQEGFGA